MVVNYVAIMAEVTLTAVLMESCVTYSLSSEAASKSEVATGGGCCAAGQFLLALFVFVRPMTYYESCLAVIFFVAAMLLIGRQQNVGSRLQASANIIGWYWPGLALGGGVVSSCIACLSCAFPPFLLLPPLPLSFAICCTISMTTDAISVHLPVACPAPCCPVPCCSLPPCPLGASLLLHRDGLGQLADM